MATRVRTTITTKALMEELGLSRRSVQSIRSKIDHAATTKLRELVDKDFLAKANHGTGTGGKWKPLAQSTIDRKGHDIIGWDTGKMRRSRVVTSNNRGITAEYRKDYSKYFDAKRPILPKTLPKPWQKEIEKSIKAAAERHLGKKLK